MRTASYLAAIIAAAGIMMYLLMTPPAPPADTAPAAKAEASNSIPADVQLASMTLNVPEMHCPFACYPAVKKELENQGEVMSVELVPQKEEGVIDKPQVVVQYAENEFDADRAIALLKAAGFDGSTLVE